MKKQKLRKYALETFLFDVEKEKIVYTYLCKDKLGRKQRKLLTDETKFNSFRSWEQHITNRYNAYNKESLIEFSKFLNFLLRDAERVTDYSKNICLAYLSSAFSVIVTTVFSQSIEDKVAFIVAIIFMPIILAILVVQIYSSYGDNKSVYFYKDVKEIIEKLIRSK